MKIVSLFVSLKVADVRKKIFSPSQLGGKVNKQLTNDAFIFNMFCY